jgi:cellulose synthase/poly-beta-1,6-N-acetylglucosamine synthase-like glycosyltransferase
LIEVSVELQVVFWVSASVIGYAYLGYPLLLFALSRLRPAPRSPDTQQGVATPTVTLLIAAHNEESCIAERLKNALATEYPPGKLQIVVASDGSRDRTNEIVRGFADRDHRVSLMEFEPRRGKAAVLNDAIRQIDGEIIVLSDANTMYEPDAVRRLTAWFCDGRVGAVCGRLVLHDSRTAQNVDGLYWRYETFLKKQEARLGGLLGANGAIYAMRRDLYVPIPDNTIIDDFVIPLLSKLKHRKLLVYDESAVAHEETPPGIADEFRRRARIGAGGYQSLSVLWPLLSPKHGWTAFTFFSHKLLRWCVPALVLLALAANLLLLPEPLYVGTLVAQLSFYLLALVGVWIRGNGLLPKLARGASLFCAMNAALAVGFWRWAVANQSGMWQRTNR